MGFENVRDLKFLSNSIYAMKALLEEYAPEAALYCTLLEK